MSGDELRNDLNEIAEKNQGHVFLEVTTRIDSDLNKKLPPRKRRWHSFEMRCIDFYITSLLWHSRLSTGFGNMLRKKKQAAGNATLYYYASVISPSFLRPVLQQTFDQEMCRPLL